MAIIFKPEDPDLQHLTLRLDAAIKTGCFQGRILRIIDGDTLEADLTPSEPIKFTGPGQSTCIVQSARLTERVRFLGIDAPETHTGDHANQQCQYLGIAIEELYQLAKLSTLHLQWLCPKGAKLTLKASAKTRDDYGRILAGVIIGDLCINQAMVEHGYAIAYQGYSQGEDYREIEARAREDGKGIWGQCTEPYYPASPSTKTYHRPGCSSAPKAGVRFSCVQEAKTKGFKPCLVCIPDFRQV